MLYAWFAILPHDYDSNEEHGGVQQMLRGHTREELQIQMNNILLSMGSMPNASVGKYNTEGILFPAEDSKKMFPSGLIWRAYPCYSSGINVHRGSV